MKLICTQDNFKKAIFNTERMVSKQNTLPILNNILIKAENNSLKLEATNLEIGIETKIGAKIEKEGRITVPARLLSNFVNSLPSQENISLEVDEQVIKLKSGKVRAVIKGLSAEEFPLIPQKNTELVFRLKNSDLRGILNKVMVSVALNEARQELSGVNLILMESELIFAATDSFRLSQYKLGISEENKNTEKYQALLGNRDNLIIPGSTLIEYNRIISANEEGETAVYIEESQIFLETNETRMVSRLINGKYPQYQHIMPENYGTIIVGDKTLFQNAVKMASIFSRGKSNEISLKIDSEAKKVFVDAQSVEVGDNSTELDFEVRGGSQEIIFNAKYLLDGLNTISSSRVALLSNSESTPVALREVTETGEILENYTYIVMPIRN